MTIREHVLRYFVLVGQGGFTDQQLCRRLEYYPPSSVRGARKNLEREGRIRKIAEELNERGYVCSVYAITPPEKS